MMFWWWGHMVDLETMEGMPTYAEFLKLAQVNPVRRFNGVGLTIFEHSELVVEAIYRWEEAWGRTNSWEARKMREHAAAHDMHEAFTSDIPTPVKAMCPGISAALNPWEERFTTWVLAQRGESYSREVMESIAPFDALAGRIELDVIRYRWPHVGADLYDACFGEIEALDMREEVPRCPT